MIIWIASYPKSGNTWVRMFLRSYFLPDGKSFSINSKGSDSFEVLNFPGTKILQELNIDFNKFENIVKNWVSIQDYINLNNKTNFLKTHNGNFTINNYPFTNTDNTAGGIYIVRDPRDVAVSMSHHSNMNNESVVEYLITNQHEIAHIDKNSKKEKQDNFRKSIMGTWSMNYLSWKSYKGRKIHFVRYEDLINDTKNEFLKILEYLKNIVNFNIDEQKLNKAIIETSFENLSNMELKNGFIEQSWEKNFFRKGKIGDWKESLDNKLSKKIEDTFYKEMEYLGYI
tara:strand:+ start:97 stop:948 length:852 start_codon:yes stop_codon:yes gene_type:complete